MNNFDGVEQTIERAISQVSDLLSQFSDDNLSSQIMKKAFGSNVNFITGQNLLTDLMADERILSALEIRSADEINGADGAFSGDTNKIYLSRGFVSENKDNIDRIAAVILEEIGHYLDWNLNNKDTIGDEGELFSALVRDVSLTDTELDRIREENDRVNITIDGETIEIEQATVSPSRNKRISSLIKDSKWGTKTISYSFFSGGSYYGDESGVTPVSKKIRKNVRHLLENVIEPLINVNFVEVADSSSSYGQIRYQVSKNPGYAYAYFPFSTDRNQGNSNDLAGDIHFNKSYDNRDDIDGFQKGLGSHGYMTIIHETLHALGLKHPGDYDGDGSGTAPFLAFAEDNLDNTVMTYNESGTQASTPMPYDILALQYLYGANKSHNSGNTTYKFTSTSGYFDGTKKVGNNNNSTKITIWDSGGIDTLDLSELESEDKGYRIDLNKGGWITKADAFKGDSYKAIGDSRNRSYDLTPYGTRIAFKVKIEKAIGSDSDDTIIGNNLDNSFIGNGGDDTFHGGKGRDVVIYSGNSSQYQIENSNGVFTVTDLISKRNGTDTLVKIENIQFDDRKITLSSVNNDRFKNRIKLKGNSISTTGKNIGARGESAEPNHAGTSGQINSVWWSWRATADGTLTISTAGSDFDTTLAVYTGTSIDNLNKIASNDDFNSVSSLVSFEAVKGKIYQIAVDGYSQDRGNIALSLNFTEKADLLAADNRNSDMKGGSDDDNLVGNEGNDVLRGNKGNDTLDGGLGADRMRGGSGDDFYFVDNRDDLSIERVDRGIDTVSSSIDYQLPDNLENLLLTDTAKNGMGNNLDNLLAGNEKDNLLDGKSGNDTLLGNNGDDRLWGYSGKDKLIGGRGDDTLTGGRGNDTLTGGEGNDYYRFDSDTQGVDTIVDFTVEDDKIAVESGGFGMGLSLGELTSNRFKTGTSATKASHRFIYHRDSGSLFFDADGNGSDSAVQIANLDRGLFLTKDNIVVI